MEIFQLQDTKPRSMPLGRQFKLSKDQSPKIKEEHDYMATVPYALAIGSLMYATVCTRPNISYEVEVVSCYVTTQVLLIRRQ